MLTFALDPYDNRTHIDETQSRLDYFCPYCGAPLITKKGEVRRHHFSHKSGCACTDSWDREYDMSDWHFLWQARFPKTNQEIRLSLGKTCHRADVVIGRTVIEFQKSPLRQDGEDGLWVQERRQPRGIADASMFGHQAAATAETKNRNSESGLALRALYHTDYRSLVKYRFLIRR